MIVEVALSAPAAGGYTVGRVDGKVVFVTGGLPGELVRAEITESKKNFSRARVVDVLRAHPQRVTPPCPVAGECGGCDWQHASPALQREVKTAVVAELLERFAGIAWDGQVQAVEPLTGWRTKMRYTVANGEVGLRGKRSHEVIPLPENGCLIAHEGLSVSQLREFAAHAEGELEVVCGRSGVHVGARQTRLAGAEMVQHAVGQRRYDVSWRGFWQAHQRAPEVLVDAVLRALQPQPGDVAVDLYCGVGLFAGALADAGCQVYGVEANEPAVAQARVNVPEGAFLAAAVGQVFAGRRRRAPRDWPQHVDLVVMDPPRKGAGPAGVADVCALRPRAVAYVSCEASTLARDLALFAKRGYQVAHLEAYDLFPMTHHVETVCLLTRA